MNDITPDEVPGRHVTINQIVGRNVTRWRTALGITQEELGRRMGGWSNATVSAAERSWDGKRVRQFDADDLVNLCGALEVPLAALFLPPEDDGATVRYLYQAPEQAVDMATLFSLLLPHSTAGSAADEQWVDALREAGTRYADPDVGADIVAYLTDVSGERQERVARLRRHRSAILALAGDLDAIVQAMEEGAQ